MREIVALSWKLWRHLENWAILHLPSEFGHSWQRLPPSFMLNIVKDKTNVFKQKVEHFFPHFLQHNFRNAKSKPNLIIHSKTRCIALLSFPWEFHCSPSHSLFVYDSFRKYTVEKYSFRQYGFRTSGFGKYGFRKYSFRKI